MIYSNESLPGNGMSLLSRPVVEASIVPLVDRERTRLLLDIKNAADFYDLHFLIAEHTGYLRGLSFSGQISRSTHSVFMVEAKLVAEAAAKRLSEVTV